MPVGFGLWTTRARRPGEPSVDRVGGAPWKLRGYVVERRLGVGACGEVWQARVAATGERVALKRLRSPTGSAARRATSEAALLAALDHPHLVRLHAVVPHEGSSVLVLDLADGGSLADLLASRGRLSPGEVITAVAPVAAALAYAHGAGVIHGDVSPANLLFTAGGVALLADLGVARLTGDDADAESTPAYVDPAVAVGCVPGPASDVFMLGGVALHALTGAPTWPGDTAEEALQAARAGCLDDVAERLAAAGVNKEMTRVVCRALEAEPHRRGTAADLALDLRHSGQPVAVELSAGRVRRPPTTPATAARQHAARHAALPAARSGAAAAGAQPQLRWRAVADQSSGSPAPTRAVAPRPRPVIPRPRPRPPLGLLVGVAATVVAALAGCLVWWQSTRPSAHAGARPSAPAGRTAPNWPRALARLDALRADAFATRDTRLLSRVYVPGPLLDADTDLLTRLVPSGCRLLGVHTRYQDVRVSAHITSARITARASLPASTLTCPGRAPRQARAAGPAILRVRLSRTPAGVRIAALQQVDA